MSFDDIYRRMLARGEIKPAKVKTSLPNGAQSAFAYDLESSIRALVDDAIAAHAAGLPKPVGERPMPRRIQQIADHMARSYAGVPRPEPSSVDAPAPSFGVEPDAPARPKLQAGDKFHMSILSRHVGSGRIGRVRFDGPDGHAFIGEVGQRDVNGRIEAVTFQMVA